MRKTTLFFFITVISAAFTACNQQEETQTTLVDFESVKLSADSISSSTGFNVGNIYFSGDPTQFWNGGIVCSAMNDTLTPGFSNQFSCMAGSGALNSHHFSVVYAPGSFTFKDNAFNYTIKSIMVTNSTYTYLDMKNGNVPFSKKFETGDWFKLILTGFRTKTRVGSVDIYLADFRNGKTNMLKTWQKVDLTSIGVVDSIAFNFDSSDKGQFGVNTPTYVCIDNIEFTKQTSTPL